MSSEVHCVTCFTYEEVARAEILGRTLKQHHPSWKLAGIVCDKTPPTRYDVRLKERLSEFDEIKFVEEFKCESLHSWVAEYDLPKVRALGILESLSELAGRGIKNILYLDCHTAVFSSLALCSELLNTFDLVLPIHTAFDYTKRKNTGAYLPDSTDSTLGFFGLNNNALQAFLNRLRLELQERNASGDRLDVSYRAFSEAHLVTMLLESTTSSHTILSPSIQTFYPASQSKIEITSDGQIRADENPVALIHFPMVRELSSIESACISKTPAWYELCTWYLNYETTVGNFERCDSWWSSNAGRTTRDVRTRYGIVRTFDEGDLISRVLDRYRQWSFFEVEFLS